LLGVTVGEDGVTAGLLGVPVGEDGVTAGLLGVTAGEDGVTAGLLGITAGEEGVTAGVVGVTAGCEGVVSCGSAGVSCGVFSYVAVIVAPSLVIVKVVFAEFLFPKEPVPEVILHSLNFFPAGAVSALMLIDSFFA
jgi:hypothetical protein